MSETCVCLLRLGYAITGCELGMYSERCAIAFQEAPCIRSPHSLLGHLTGSLLCLGFTIISSLPLRLIQS